MKLPRVLFRLILLILAWIQRGTAVVAVDANTNVSIRNGTDAPTGKYPFYVGIHIRGYGLICGGTLIHPGGVVLTAAHCRNFGYGRLPLFLFSIEMDGIRHAVNSAQTHPSYHPRHIDRGGDLMLLFFNNTMNSTSRVVSLNSDTTVPVVGATATLCGKGLVAPNWRARPPRLQEVTDLEVSDCPWEDEEGHWLCTRPGPSDANVCNFDSGSPLLLMNDHVLQIGIVSNGDKDPSGLCVSDYAAYTPVADYHDWIQSQLQQHSISDFSTGRGCERFVSS